jgi:hydrogenase expression/formation protein HypD
MKYLDEFRDGEMAQTLARDIRQTATRKWSMMEVCGGQTHSIVRNGIDQLLEGAVEMIHGPGCPVCVTPLELIDKALAIASEPGIIFCSFGDMLRVPGSKVDLFRVKADGGDIRVVYSPLDALQIARQNPDREVVFFGIGFETTAPANAMAVHQAKLQGISNFSMLVSHVLVPPAIEAIMITGFEPLDLLEGIRRTVHLLEAGTPQVENAYERAVCFEGNQPAQKLLSEVFEVTDRGWRGIGTIPKSGWKLSEAYRDFDAELRFDVSGITAEESPLCHSGEVLQGNLKPNECPSFGSACTPRRPLGATMVSSEGACAAYYNYGRFVALESIH